MAVVHARVAFVDVGAAETCSRPSSVARAREAPDGVTARGVAVAVIAAECALINVGASYPVARVTFIARTCEAPDRVTACGVGVTVVTAQRAFVNVAARQTVARVACVASTREATDSVAARCHGIAIVAVGHAPANGTLVIVCLAPRATVPRAITSTGVPDGSCRRARPTMKARVGRATGQVGALIHVSPRSLGCRLAIAVVAVARIRARGVGASRIAPTNVEECKRALVHVDARDAVDVVVVNPAGGASACKRPNSVAARCVCVAVAAGHNTLVDVGARSA